MSSKQPTTQASSTVFQFPKAASFGKKLPKEKIYKFASPSHAVKQKFVQQIDKIIWQFKLSPETINIPATKSISEIQVFDIVLKESIGQRATDELVLDDSILRTIDRAIAFPLYYRLHCEGKTQYCMAYKRPSEADNTQWVVSDYFFSHLQNSEQDNSNAQMLPITLDLNGLYEQLLRSLIAEPINAQETLKQQLERLALIKNKQRELCKLQSRLYKEKQFNRKVEINQHVNQLKTELRALQTSATTVTKQS